ncbi:hypothetical protein ACHQM5_000645 [Ranunculus cassubicifolius]
MENQQDGKKVVSACDVDALKRCLAENKGDHSKCQAEVDAFKQSCSLKKPNSVDSSPVPTISPSNSPEKTQKVTPMKLRRGLMSDV